MIDSKYLQYAEDVLTGKIVAGNLIKLACQRYLNWINGSEDDIEFRHDKVDRVVTFISKLHHSTGQFANKPFILSDWQFWCCCVMYGFYYRSSGRRVCRNAYIQISRKCGKALDLKTLIPTPDGFKFMEDIHVGDYVFDRLGNPTKVIYESPIYENHDCYKVEFQNGDYIIADAEHNWSVYSRIFNRNSHNTKVMTTKEMYDYGIYKTRKDGKGKEYNWRVPRSSAVNYPKKDLLIEPYVLGLWLSDGYSKGPTFTSTLKYDDYKIYDDVVPFYGNYKIREDKRKDTNIDILFGWNRTEKIDNYHTTSLLGKQLIELDLINNKHIPKEYIYGSVEQRLALLQGLMDTDGTVSNYGQCEIQQKNYLLSQQIVELIRSLGYIVKYTTKVAKYNGKDCGKVYRITFYADKSFAPFRMKRKYERLPDKLNVRSQYNTITSITPCLSVPVKCIQVDNDEHLYLAGRCFTVTHNTSFASALALYAMCADDEPNSEVDIVAPSSSQSQICFKSATEYLETINRKNIFKTLRTTIHFKAKKSHIKIFSSDAKYGDGYNTHLGIVDEYHAFVNNDVPNLLQTSMGMRRNPMLIFITTAGFNMFSPCKEYRDLCVEILHGKKEDNSIFAAIYELDEDDDWTDPSVWKKGCPSLGITVDEEYMHSQIKKAINNPSEEVNVKTKNLNIWCQSQDIWIPDEYILSSTDEVSFDDFTEDDICYAGIDLASVNDLTSVTFMFPPREGREKWADKFVFKSICYIPSDNIHETLNVDIYREAIKQKYLKKTPGNVTDYDYILKDILSVQSRVLLYRVCYDTWNSTQFAINAESAGVPLHPYSQALGNFNKPCKEYERLMRSGHIILDNNGLVRWCHKNVEIKSDWNDNSKPVKAQGKRNNKIDPVISSLEALGGYLEVKGGDYNIV